MGAVGALRMGGVVFVIMTLLLGGCGGDRPANPKPTSTALTELGGCIKPSDATLLHHEGGGIVADVALFGTGDVTAVVTYETFRDVCTWLPLAKRLAAAGHQVLLYDQVIGEGSEQINEMVKLARQRGAQQIVLVGGSLGGEESIAAAAVIKPPVNAVVALAPASISGEEAASLEVPFLQIVARGDVQFADSARKNEAAATKSPDHRLLIVGGSEHASLMFGGKAAKQVLDAVVAFIGKATV